jgi:hypothetical protein
MAEQNETMDRYIPSITTEEFEKFRPKFLNYIERIGLSEEGFQGLEAEDKNSFFLAFLKGIKTIR